MQATVPELTMSMFGSKSALNKARRIAVTKALNLHPNWRFLSLSHIRMVRSMMREGRQVSECRQVIKSAQREMAYCRKAIADALK